MTNYFSMLQALGKGDLQTLMGKWNEAVVQAEHGGYLNDYMEIVNQFKHSIGASAFSAVDPSTQQQIDISSSAIDALKQAKHSGHVKEATDIYAKINSSARLPGKATAYNIWAGRETGMGAGIFFYCASTGRFLLVKRSGNGDGGGTWATLGGGVDPGEVPEEAALRECLEEGGFLGDVELLLMYVSKQTNFTYYNFLGLVESEFQPVLNDEHTDAVWAYPDDFPYPLLPPFEDALMNSPLKEHFGF